MSIMDDFRRLMHKEEYEAEKAREASLNEATEENRRELNKTIHANELPAKRIRYNLARQKAVITEATARLYMKSLIIENADQYKNSLMPIARKEIVKTLAEFEDTKSLYEHISKCSPYLRALLPICEAVCENAPDEEVEKFDGSSVTLTSDEVKLIDQFEKDHSQDVYAGCIQDRILDVYKEEEDRNKEQKEKVQAVVDALSDAGETVEESVGGGINVFDNEPKSVFNAIFVNKSKAIINEAGAGLDISAYAEDIICETICTYTLLECIHSLGLKTYSEDDKERLKYEFIVG